MRMKVDDYDWVAVSAAVDGRIKDLGWTEDEVAKRSGISKMIVREIRHNTLRRSRNSSTLESLSTAFGWHPQHLFDVARGKEPPSLDDAPGPGILGYLERQHREIVERLDGLDARFVSLDARIVSPVDNHCPGGHERRLPP